MTPFDARAYEQHVVKPLRGRVGSLPDDLLARYAVDLDMTDSELASRLADVRAHWKRSESSAVKAPAVRAVYRSFLAEDRLLDGEHGEMLTQREWWAQYHHDRSRSRRGEIDDLVHALRSGYGDLGLITATQLDTIVRAHFPTLTPTDVEHALLRAEVRSGVPVELPKVSGLAEDMYARLDTLLSEIGARSIPALVAGREKTVRLLSEMSAGTELTERGVVAAIDRESAKSNTQNTREALGILRVAAQEGIDLRLLALYHLVEPVRLRHRNGADARRLLRYLVDSGLEPDEARQTVVSVLSETGSVQPIGLAAITALLDAGRLVDATNALATLTRAKDLEVARGLVERQAGRARELREAGRAALARGDEETARRDLDEALALAADDAGLVAEFHQIPSAPVAAVTAEPVGLGVRISWQRAAKDGKDTQFLVVRGEGKPPEIPHEGKRIASCTTTEAVDEAAPAARTLSYAVFASTDGTNWSRPAHASIEILPSVHAVRLVVDDQGVSGQWRVHPDAITVSVRRDPGGAVRGADRTSFRDAGASVNQNYALTASYRRADGSEAAAAPVVTNASREAGPTPVPMLRLKPAGDGDQASAEISWSQVPTGDVVVRRAPAAAPWGLGDRLSAAEMTSYGEELVGDVTIEENWTTLTAHAPAGVFWYVPFTVDAEGAVVCGSGGQLGVTRAVSNLSYQRLGKDVVLSWSWPTDCGLVNVEWEFETPIGGFSLQEKKSDRLTRHQYLNDGGFHLTDVRGSVRVWVRSVVVFDGAEWLSAPVERVVPAIPPTVQYTVKHRRSLTGPGGVVVSLTAQRTIVGCQLLIVVAPGRVMPSSPREGQVVLRETVTLQAGQTVAVSVTYTKPRKPYWIRCFIEGENPIQLVDPPTSDLKVL